MKHHQKSAKEMKKVKFLKFLKFQMISDQQDNLKLQENLKSNLVNKKMFILLRNLQSDIRKIFKKNIFKIRVKNNQKKTFHKLKADLIIEIIS
jgi:hypothetical protein